MIGSSPVQADWFLWLCSVDHALIPFPSVILEHAKHSNGDPIRVRALSCMCTCVMVTCCYSDIIIIKSIMQGKIVTFEESERIRSETGQNSEQGNLIIWLSMLCRAEKF